MAHAQATREERRKARRRRQEARSRKQTGADGGRPPKSKLREWFDALFFALVVMLIIRTFLFDLFRIPTPSMEKNLLVGDYLFVSKLHYGTRTPITLGVPFTQIHLKGLTLPHTRLPGFSEVERGDAVVFNYPPEDLPVDRKMHYIKRVVGLPGETLQVQDKVVSVDGEALPLMAGMQQLWDVYKTSPSVSLSASMLASLGVSDVRNTSDPLRVRLLATPEAIAQVREWSWIDRVEPAVAPENAGYGTHMYPPGRGYTPDNFGPVTIPAEGMTVPLNDETWPVYETVIDRYEGRTARRLADGRFEIDGMVVDTYTFGQDYYFMMGDNRDNSEDSRFWGFVPYDHIVGKALMVYFSWDAESKLPRFGRMFHLID